MPSQQKLNRVVGVAFTRGYPELDFKSPQDPRSEKACEENVEASGQTKETRSCGSATVRRIGTFSS